MAEIDEARGCLRELEDLLEARSLVGLADAEAYALAGLAHSTYLAFAVSVLEEARLLDAANAQFRIFMESVIRTAHLAQHPERLVDQLGESAEGLKKLREAVPALKERWTEDGPPSYFAYAEQLGYAEGTKPPSLFTLANEAGLGELYDILVRSDSTTAVHGLLVWQIHFGTRLGVPVHPKVRPSESRPPRSKLAALICWMLAGEWFDADVPPELAESAEEWFTGWGSRHQPPDGYLDDAPPQSRPRPNPTEES